MATVETRDTLVIIMDPNKNRPAESKWDEVYFLAINLIKKGFVAKSAPTHKREEADRNSKSAEPHRH